MIFHEVMALPSATELADFAAGKNLVPATLEICTPMASSTATVRKASAKVAKKK
jgi:hypothetical protein